MFFEELLKNKNAITYERVSTKQQDTRGSKTEQRKENLQFCQKYNINVLKSFDDTDHGDSRTRKSFEEMKKYIELHQEIELIVVYHSDRFTRDAEIGVFEYLFLTKHNVKLISVLERKEIIYELKLDNLVDIVKLMTFGDEKEKYNQKTKKRMYSYAQNSNRYLGGHVFPWLRAINYKNEIGERYKIAVKNEETWYFYRKAIYEDSIKYNDIRLSAKRNNVDFTKMSRWINSPDRILLGYRSFGKKGKIDKDYKRGLRDNYSVSKTPVYPALLSEYELYDLYKLLDLPTYKLNVKRFYNYLYTKVAHCSCGGKFAGEKMRQYFYYKCESCKKRIRAEDLEDNISIRLLNSSELRQINDIEFRISDLYDEIERIKLEIEKTKTSESKIIDLLSDDVMSMDNWTKLEKIKTQRNLKESELIKIKELVLSEEKKIITEDNIENFKYLLENIDNEFIDEFQEIIKLIIRKIIIHDINNIEIKF